MIIGSEMDIMCMLMAGINWVIIGAQTKPYKPPKIEWVKEIVEAADRAGIPVFLKDNLKPLFTDEQHRIFYPEWALNNIETDWRLRQEMPENTRKEVIK
ncbi:hypothetical protein ES708_17478 [subsurface metagenome]